MVPTLAVPVGKTEAIFFDDDIAGFGLRIRAGGGRVWVFQYKLGLKHRRLTLGSANSMDVATARSKARLLQAAARMGQDPAGEKIETRSKAHETFEHVARRFLAVQQDRQRPRSYTAVERYILACAKPLHALLLTKITRATIASLLTDLTASSGPVAANRCRSTLSAFFAWAIREGIADENPVIGTSKRDEKSRHRVLSDRELREVWLAAADEIGFGAIVRLLILTGQRRNEIANLPWSEVDLDAALITLPPDRTKNGRLHQVPLSAAAAAIIARQPRRLGRDLIFGFGKGGYSGWGAAKRLLDAVIAKAADGNAIAPWCLHDLRRTAATHMAELGVAPHVIEAVLNHTSGHKAGVAGIYNRASYAAEKAAALALWAEHVVALEEGRSSKVVALRA